MRYAVSVLEKGWGSVEVEAGSRDEAIEKASEAYYAGNIFWADSECEFNISLEATVND